MVITSIDSSYCSFKSTVSYSGAPTFVSQLDFHDLSEHPCFCWLVKAMTCVMTLLKVSMGIAELICSLSSEHAIMTRQKLTQTHDEIVQCSIINYHMSGRP